MASATKTETSPAQGRFVVSLPKEVGEQVDQIGARIATKVQEETGVSFELSRAQVVQALVKSALAEQTQTNGAEAAPAE